VPRPSWPRKKLSKRICPHNLSDDELGAAIDGVVSALGVSGPQAMGQVIGAVKQTLARRQTVPVSRKW